MPEERVRAYLSKITAGQSNNDVAQRPVRATHLTDNSFGLKWQGAVPLGSPYRGRLMTWEPSGTIP